jgi:transcriptional regulator NrdR family protein
VQQLQVIKADDSCEPYLHTKVIATFVNAFVEPAEKNTFLASELAESVTYYLYNNRNADTITSSEIFSIIKAVLSSTGFDFAAQVIAEHSHRRNLLRARVQVVKAGSTRIAGLADNTEPWNKSKIINRLIAEQNLDQASARTVASLVEEKIVNSGFNLVPTDFIKFLVNWLMQSLVNETASEAQADVNVENMQYNAVTDDRSRQPQNGLCEVKG